MSRPARPTRSELRWKKAIYALLLALFFGTALPAILPAYIYLTGATFSGDISYGSNTDISLIKKVFHSGDSWILICHDNHTLSASDHLIQRIGTQTSKYAQDDNSNSNNNNKKNKKDNTDSNNNKKKKDDLPTVLVGVFNCSESLPSSGKSFYSRFGLEKKATDDNDGLPLIYSIANGERPRRISKDLYLYLSQKSSYSPPQFKEIINNAAKNVVESAMNYLSIRSIHTIKNNDQFRRYCYYGKVCAMILNDGPFLSDSLPAITIKSLQKEYRNIWFNTIDINKNTIDIAVNAQKDPDHQWPRLVVLSKLLNANVIKEKKRQRDGEESINDNNNTVNNNNNTVAVRLYRGPFIAESIRLFFDQMINRTELTDFIPALITKTPKIIPTKSSSTSTSSSSSTSKPSSKKPSSSSSSSSSSSTRPSSSKSSSSSKSKSKPSSPPSSSSKRKKSEESHRRTEMNDEMKKRRQAMDEENDIIKHEEAEEERRGGRDDDHNNNNNDDEDDFIDLDAEQQDGNEEENASEEENNNDNSHPTTDTNNHDEL